MMAKVKDNLTNDELLEKIKVAAKSLVLNALHGDMDQAKHWRDSLLCGKWCAEQRGINKVLIETKERSGVDDGAKEFYGW